MANSSRKEFDGLFGEDAKNAVIKALEYEKSGHGTVQYRLKDWLLSRQRFWGTPIPMLHCDDCGVVPVPLEDLPVKLPLDVKFSWDESGNPLESSDNFLLTKCPKCGRDAKRETDTMDTFYDSSWYFLRYGDSKNENSPFNRETIDYWMEGGIDLYIGGIEHAVMHLLYARFFTKATRDLGMNTTGEPFGQLVCQGMLNAPAPFCIECNTEYHVDNFEGNCPSCKSLLTTRQAKMSKSWEILSVQALWSINMVQILYVYSYYLVQTRKQVWIGQIMPSYPIHDKCNQLLRPLKALIISPIHLI